LVVLWTCAIGEPPMVGHHDSYELILVGTGFASSFFLLEYLRHVPAPRVLVLERGEMLTHAEHGLRRGELQRRARESYVTTTPWKPWAFNLAFGGGSNCWVACTPRMTPEDFQLRTRYGVATDWPLRYDDLERYYCEAEEVMAVSGPLDGGPWPRSRPYPQPPHRLSEPDERLRAADPRLWCEQPCARPTRPTPRGRPACCATGVCTQCPVDSKFTVLNELRYLYEADGVELRTGARVLEVEHAGADATGIRWLERDGERRARGALVGLGANAIFNPHLLLRSGLDGPEVGRGLVEQVAVHVDVNLDGVDGFAGSTSITALGLPLHDGPHRAHHAAALIESLNAPVRLRDLRGRWRQRLGLKVIFEDLRQPGNRVTLSRSDPERPEVTFSSYSSYARAGIASLAAALPPTLRALPVEDLHIGATSDSEGHVLGTTPMGEDPRASVVDAGLRHHRLRNLLVLGGSVFPTCPPANPTLTLSALSMRAADRLFA
jgi:choline dehydrogenase-like flavoprotein